jgi:lambda family phage portal protein
LAKKTEPKGIKMNALDKLVSVVSPEKACRRMAARYALEQHKRFVNSGYDQGGASHDKAWARGFNADSNSPQEDIDYNLKTLRERSRVLEMTAPLATAAINTTATKTVGYGLYLKPCLDYEFLGMTKEEAEKWERNTEREFALWAESKFCDATRIHTFYEMQELIFRGMLSNGDGIGLIKYDKPTPYMPYELRLHIIESDRVSSPLYSSANVEKSLNYTLVEGINQKNGNRIINGIEIDDDGKLVAYWICNRYPEEYIRLHHKERKWIRIEAYGKLTGNPNVLHLFTATRASAYRGVPLLAPVIESLKQLTRYSDAEIMAAVVSGMFTVFVKSNGASSNNPLQNMFGGYNPYSVQQPPPDSEEEGGDKPRRSSADELAIGNGAITVLEDGEDISIANPTRPNANYDGFITSVYKQIGAALEIPYEVLLKSFNSSYSASRAALLEAAEMFKKRRMYLQDDFCQPVYEMWLAEAVAKGRIEEKGFFSDPLIHKAWCSAKWTATATVPVLDPVKEATAAEIRVRNGFTTREQETVALNGGDYKSNVQQLARENKMLVEANASLNSAEAPKSAGADNPKMTDLESQVEELKEDRYATQT